MINRPTRFHLPRGAHAPVIDASRRTLVIGCMAAVLLGICSVATRADSRREAGRYSQVVRPGQSIQAAINAAAPGGWVFIRPGVYREDLDATNGLVINKPLQLIGLNTRQEKVILETATGQRNGVVVVPHERSNCMSCHTSLAPPFATKPDVPLGRQTQQSMLRGVVIRGLTIRGFGNNGLFMESVDGFVIDAVESIDNANYGIFPTLSRNGLITRSRATGSGDSGVWVETSSNIRVTHTVSEGNVIGFEVSNSEKVTLQHNVSRDNSIGVGVLLLPFLFEDRPGLKSVDLLDNRIYDNNRPNNAPAEWIVSALPSGVGVLYMGADTSTLRRNYIANNGLAGIAIADACFALSGSPLDCSLPDSNPPEFLADQEATRIKVAANRLQGNGMNAPPHPFSFAASDMALLSYGEGNCFAHNEFQTMFSLVGSLPACR